MLTTIYTYTISIMNNQYWTIEMFGIISLILIAVMIIEHYFYRGEK